MRQVSTRRASARSERSSAGRSAADARSASALVEIERVVAELDGAIEETERGIGIAEACMEAGLSKSEVHVRVGDWFGLLHQRARFVEPTQRERRQGVQTSSMPRACPKRRCDRARRAPPRARPSSRNWLASAGPTSAGSVNRLWATSIQRRASSIRPSAAGRASSRGSAMARSDRSPSPPAPPRRNGPTGSRAGRDTPESARGPGGSTWNGTRRRRGGRPRACARARARSGRARSGRPDGRARSRAPGVRRLRPIRTSRYRARSRSRRSTGARGRAGPTRRRSRARAPPGPRAPARDLWKSSRVPVAERAPCERRNTS